MTIYVGISSIQLWLFMEGEQQPIRGWADGNGYVADCEVSQTPTGERYDCHKKIDLSKVVAIKKRIGWHGFSTGGGYDDINFIKK